MFGAKKEKKNAALREISGQKEAWEEQFAVFAASAAQIEKKMQQLTELSENVAELSAQGEATADGVRGVLTGAKNTTESFRANHTLFLENIKKQNEKLRETAEAGDTVQKAAEAAAELSGPLREEYAGLCETADIMREASKNMSVLALNAAIEAGRMGESGRLFIASAEEIRAFSEQYEKAADELQERMRQMEERMAALEEQIAETGRLAHEQNVSVNRAFGEGMQMMSAYESGQIELKELIPADAVGRADALQQAQAELSRIGAQIKVQTGELREELSEQKSCGDAVEEICGRIGRIAEAELTE